VLLARHQLLEVAVRLQHTEVLRGVGPDVQEV
jgi:hypothetical protein